MEIRFKLYSREYCHLCHDLLAALQSLRDEAGSPADFVVDVVDVDAETMDPLLLARYDEKVPVLVAMTAEGEHELCHYFLDRAAVLDYLQSRRPVEQTGI
ncbi:MAG: glutaredoxin family protein [Sterolibacterium sp.]|nr:glutaredoxin family protein [Sterolibacterium sp.]